MKIKQLTAFLTVAILALGLSAFNPPQSAAQQDSSKPPAPANAAPAKEAPTKEQKLELLFVQNATSGTFDGKTLTLEGMGPTIFFSDRPERVTGQVLTQEFISHWGKSKDNNFDVDPPNATLSIFGKDKVTSAVVELRNPKLVGNTLAYNVKVLKGDLPKSFQESSLFIDIYGRWAAVAGGMMLGGAIARNRSYYYHPPAVVYAPGSVYVAPQPYYYP